MTIDRPMIQIATPATGEEEWQAVREPIMSGWLTQGPKVAEFERRWAARHRTSHALATTSCTTGLHLSLVALGVGPGDEVIVPAFTWVATANVVVHCGATPVFVDVETTSYNIDASQVAESITAKTKAIIAVHLFGLPAAMEELAQVAGDIPILEDAACAAGASLGGRPAGSIGTAGVFSLHPRKTITTGEGGMITTGDSALAERMTQLRNHGASVPEEVRHHGPKPYLLPDFNLLGFNYRMTDLQGAVGLVQLAKLDALLAERRRWASFYAAELAAVRWLSTPAVPDDVEHGWQAYVCRVDEQLAPRRRDALMEVLQADRISTRPGTHAVTDLGYYRERFGVSPADFPVARTLAQTTMAIPLHNRMSPDDYQHVVESLRRLA